MKIVSYTIAKSLSKSTTQFRQKLKKSVKELRFQLKIIADKTKSDSSSAMMAFSAKRKKGRSSCVENAIVSKIS